MNTTQAAKLNNHCDRLNTDDLYILTHGALCRSEWAAADIMLSYLGRRENKDSLCTLATYTKDARLAGRDDLSDHKAWMLRVRLTDLITDINYRVANR